MKRRSAPDRAIRQVFVVLWGMVAGALVFTGPAIQHAAAQTLTDSVTVNATAGLGTIPSDAIGLNTAVYDGYMNDTPIPGPRSRPGPCWSASCRYRSTSRPDNGARRCPRP